MRASPPSRRLNGAPSRARSATCWPGRWLMATRSVRSFASSITAAAGPALERPALERLRDLAAMAVIDRLYVHAPDRLARNYAYQAVLVEEFARAGMEVFFLERPTGQSAADNLLLQLQGMFSEYERTKMLER